MAEGLAAGSTGLEEGVGLYHMMLEGVVFAAGQRALSTTWSRVRCRGCATAWDASSSTSAGTSASGCGAWPRCGPHRALIEDLMDRAQEAAEVWGDLVPAGTRKFVVDMCHRRLSAAGLLAGAQGRLTSPRVVRSALNGDH